MVQILCIYKPCGVIDSKIKYVPSPVLMDFWSAFIDVVLVTANIMSLSISQIVRTNTSGYHIAMICNIITH